jgi:amino acid adenylation domain-containing protein
LEALSCALRPDDVLADIVSVLRHRAAAAQQRPAFIFLAGGESETARLDFALLDLWARAVASRLQGVTSAGERALLLYPPGLDYIKAFLGCLYAGVVAVPAYPPSRHHIDRLRAIVEDSSPAVVLTTASLQEKLADGARMSWERGDLVWLATDDLLPEAASRWMQPQIFPETLAFLQYTSGSTGRPKGVMVNHGALMANEAAIQRAFAHDVESTVVGWLPLYHDMGLIGNVLQPLYVGATSVLMPPLAFLEKPVRWLRAISTYRAHTSGGPNFGYEFCLRKIKPEDRHGLDLSSWRLAFNGSEPVRASTLERFAAAFAGCGFRREAFFPCYGLAEATLFVSGACLGSGPAVRQFSLEAPPQGPAGGAVRCGRVAPGHALRIVDPQTLTDCGEGQTGEIWLAGPSVASGYWGHPAETEQAFRACMTGNGGGGPFLRTGDLGFLHEGELYISGRIKDILILRGRNFDPSDLERAVEEEAEGLLPGGTAAFTVTHDGEEALVLAAEVQRQFLRAHGAAPLFRTICSAIAKQFGVDIHEIALVPPGGVPRTTSGKIRRGACRQAYLSGDLKLLARSGGLAPQEESARETLLPGHGAAERERIESLLCGEAARQLGCPQSGIDPSKSLAELGLSSLRTIALKHAADAAFGIDVPLALLVSDCSLAELTAEIAGLPPSDIVRSQLPDMGTGGPPLLSQAERAISTVHRLDETGVLHNLHMAIELAGDLDAGRLQSSLLLLLGRHEQLRRLYPLARGAVEPRAASPGEIQGILEAVDATGWTASKLQAALATEVRRPFDLAQSPPLRAVLFRLAPQRHVLLFCAHHICADFWSLLLLLQELDSAYAACGQGEQPRLMPPPSHAGFIASEAAYLAGPDAARDFDYWREALAGLPPPLALPVDFPRPAAPDHRGASVALRLDPAAAAALRALAARERVSLFTLLLAIWQVLLHRYTGQSDIIAGAPSSGRLQGRFAGLVANCVNPVALRGRIHSGKPFLNFLRELGETVRNGLAHQQFPFSLLIGRLRPERHGGQWPIYQTWFVLQQTPPEFSQALSLLPLGETGEPFALCGCTAVPLALRERVENFDLKLMAAETSQGLVLSFQYRTALFRPETVDRMAGHFRMLTGEILRSPECPVGALRMLMAQEVRLHTKKWNETKRDWPGAGFLPQLLEDRARAQPEAPALIFGDQQLGYAELNRRANRVAHALLARGIGGGAVVAICARRSIEMVIGLLGIIKAGAAYLPLDPDDPAERIAALCSDAQPKCFLVQRGLETGLPGKGVPVLKLDAAARAFASEPDCNPERDILAGQLAYVIFTSGSTGRPKGAGIHHAGLRNRLLWMQDFIPIGPHDAILQKTSYTFDVSVWELFWPLVAGARLVLAGPDDHRDPHRLIELIRRHGVTVMHFVPSLLRVFLDTAGLDGCVSLRHVICSGEALTSDLVRRFKECSPARLHNFYGPTEASIDVSATECSGPSDISIGHPAANTALHVLDSGLNPVPVNVPGELYIGGVQLARGYIGRAGLTAAAFIPDPFGPAGSRLYRTGDLARRRSDGSIEYVGRMDRQVKIRGFRIELEEIEACLLKHPEAAAAAVLALDDAEGERRLVAWLQCRVRVAKAQEARKAEELRQHIRTFLPSHMVPAAFVFLDALPLTVSGKLDRKRLPAPDIAAQFATGYVAPRDDIEAALARIWEGVLQIERVGVEDNFFALGGDSIRGILMASRARDAGLRLSPAALFRHPTVAELARIAQPAEAAAPAANSPPPLPLRERLRPEDFPLATLSQEELDSLPAGPQDVEDIYPLTPMQEGILFHSLSDRGTGIYVMQDRYSISGRIDPQALERAWQLLVDRHAIFRTSFLWKTAARPHQLVHRKATLSVNFFDWASLPAQEQEERLETLLAAERTAGFDLARAPLMHIRLLRLGEDRHLLVRSFHHIIMDEWCTSPLFLQFREIYARLVRGLAPEPSSGHGQFRDYVAYLQRQDSAEAERFWRRQLARFTGPAPLVAQQPSSGSPDIAGPVEDAVAELSAADTAELNELSRRQQLTVNTFIQGALALLLARYSNRAEVLFGVTVAGRPAALPGVESVIGLFINALPLRVRIEPDQTVAQWLRGILEQNIEMRCYEHVSLADIQSWSDIPRSSGQLFQHLLTFENAPVDPGLRGEADGIRLELTGNRVHTNYPITFVAIPGARLKLRLTYQRDRFDHDAMARMLGHLKTLIEGLIRGFDGKVGEVGLLSLKEQRALCGWNDTGDDAASIPDVVASFEAQAKRTPDRVAISCCGAALTYDELNRRANRAARGLAAKGIGRDILAALLADRGVDFLVMVLGIFKAGGAYLPLDPAHPDGRILQLLEESRAGFLFHSETYRGRAENLCWQAEGAAPVRIGLDGAEEAGVHAGNLAAQYSARNLAVVITTSGSTGKPKGAMVDRLGMVNNLLTKVPALGLTEADVIAQTASQTFDISVWQYLTAITIGARVEVFPDKISREPPRLLKELARAKVTVLEAVPSMIRALLEAAEETKETLPALRWLLPCGEAFPPELCRRWMQRFPSMRLLNAYGPAECSDDVSYHPIEMPGEGDLTVPIGRPVERTRLYILDRWLDPAPAMVPGEICVGGIQVGRGYLNRPDLTAAAFIPDPFGPPGGRLYRTGDLGQFRADGVIEFLGRIDHQLKIRGNRVEPGEIEACLLTFPGVREAVAAARPGRDNVPRLIAYLTGTPASAEQLRQHIRRKLPEFMVPSAFVFLDAMPLTPNGKADRRRLPDPALDATPDTHYAAPRSPAEEILAGIFAEILDIKQPGVDDNFFDLGGHSLLATRVASRIRQAFGIELPLRAIFEHPTIARLASVIASPACKTLVPALLPAPRETDLPLSFAQQRLWYMAQLDPDNPFYNYVAAIRMSGSLDAEALRKSLNGIVSRHEILRTAFVFRDGTPVQAVLPALDIPLARIELTKTPRDQRMQELMQALNIESRKPFDLATPPLLRASLFVLEHGSGSAASDHVLLLVFHHIVFDGWSFAVFVKELAALYQSRIEGFEASLAPLPFQYGDFAAWQRSWLKDAELERRLAWWTAHLAGAPPLLELPSDFPRASQPPDAGDRLAFEVVPELARTVRELCRRRGVTLFMLMLGVFTLLLHVLSRRDDIVVGADIAGRQSGPTEGLIGFFVNLLALRTNLGGNPRFSEVLARLREVTLNAFANQDVPFNKVVEALQPPRSLAFAPIFQVKLVLHNIPFAEVRLRGLELRPLDLTTGQTELDLVLHIFEDGAGAEEGTGLRAIFEYRTDLFTRPTIERFAALYLQLLEKAVADPEERIGALASAIAQADRGHHLKSDDLGAAAGLSLAALRGRRIARQINMHCPQLKREEGQS